MRVNNLCNGINGLVYELSENSEGFSFIQPKDTTTRNREKQQIVNKETFLVAAD